MIVQLYDCFKHWSKSGSVYILSDLHFNDKDTKLMNPDWISPEKQLEIINKMAHKNDTFICLGDVGDASYIDKIKAGYKVLITGNHDKLSDVKGHFDEIYDGPLFIGDRLLLSHEPIIGLTRCVNIHGHVHNGEYMWIDHLGGSHINLAADVCGFVPNSLSKLIKDGVLSKIKHIHRQTIDKAILNPVKK